MPQRRTVCDEYVNIIWDEIPLFLDLGASWEVKGPVAKLWLPGRAPDSPAFGDVL